MTIPWLVIERKTAELPCGEFNRYKSITADRLLALIAIAEKAQDIRSDATGYEWHGCGSVEDAVEAAGEVP